MYNENNIFAKILRKEIPCDKIYEDEHSLFFKDVTDYTSGFVCLKKDFFKNYSLSGYYGDYFVDLIIELKKNKRRIIEIPFKDSERATGLSKTLVTINLKYLYTCFRYFVTLIKSYLKYKFSFG